MGIVDFTNPGAWKWYQSKLRHLLDQGVDCFKTDFGERIPTDVVYYDGSDPLRMHNYYTYLYNKCVWEVLEEYKGKNVREAKDRLFSLHVPQLLAVRSSRYTGAVTARRTTPPCPNPCAAAFPCAFPASASGATT